MTLTILAIRLRGFDRHHAGRIEVLHNGIWGTINSFDNPLSFTEGRVVCQQLGYHDALRILNLEEVPDAWKKINWAKNITCNGNENRLQNCSWSLDNDEYVHHSNDGGVICKLST